VIAHILAVISQSDQINNLDSIVDYRFRELDDTENAGQLAAGGKKILKAG
jgi:hypothetical protein